MNSGNPIFTYWYFHIPNLILAAWMYTLIGRFVLGFIFDDKSDNYIWRFFIKLTDPVVNFVRFFTPLAVPSTIILLLAVVWMFGARILLFLLLAMLGIAPTTGI